MKTIQFNLFGREILLRYVFHITRKPKALHFRSLVFKDISNDEACRVYQAEMRISGAYLIKVSPFGNGYHVDIYRSGKKVEFLPYCTEEEVTALMQMIQFGQYQEPNETTE